MPTTEPAWATRLRHALIRLDVFIVCTALLLLLVLVLAQIVLRNFLGSSLPYADILSRYLVLYVTFFGAALAIEEHRHIKLDILSAFVDTEQIQPLRRFLYLLSAVICAILTWAAWRFWYDDWQYVAEHERWSSILALVTPFGFALLCAHFLLGALFPPPVEGEAA